MPHLIPVRAADTSPEAEAVQVSLLRAAPVERRLRLALGLTATVIAAARRAIARSRPGLSKRDVDLRFVEIHYGADVATGLRAELERREREDRPSA